MNTDFILADEIEDGDQISINGDLLENVRVSGDPDDINIVIVTGWSHNSGDTATYHLNYDDDVELWSL